MPALSRLAFEIRPAATDGTPRSLMVTPHIDGETLVGFVTRFEDSRGYEPADGYAGVVPDFFHYGELRAYFLGQADDQWPDPGRLCLLACGCGEVGCWPLEAGVSARADTVTWTDSEQPHLEDRDYSGFGPFVFDRAQYEQAVDRVAQRFEPAT